MGIEPFLYLFLGLAMLVGAGELLVRGAVGLAKKMKVSTLVVGMTVVSIGTSAPELLVSIKAALPDAQGIAHPDISIGNVIGSNIANIALVLALTILIFPIVIDPQTLRIDWPVMMTASLLFWVFVLDGSLAFWEGLVFVVFLSSFIFWMVRRSRKQAKAEEEAGEKEGAKPNPVLFMLLYVAVGCFGLMYGAEWMLDGAIEIARGFGVSEHVIAVTIVAFGTSVPELATSCIAAFRKETDISVGNLIGSNLFNILAILGITSLITEVPVSERVLGADIFWMLGISFVLLPMMLLSRKLGRVHGVVLLAGYVTYVVISLT